MWQVCHVCRRAPLLCVAITLTKVYLFFFLSPFALQVLFEPKIMKFFYE